jgi:CRISPR-associated protein Cas5h
MMKILVFDLWGEYAHYKKIYATTSALSYAFPPKTALYGVVGAILGLPKGENEYLKYFSDKQCLMGISLLQSVKTQRIGINFRKDISRYKDNPKPTMVELVKSPRYRVYFYHQNDDLYSQLRESLMEHQCVFTPSLGLANLVANFAWVGEYEAELIHTVDAVQLDTVVPLKLFKRFGPMEYSDIVEQTMFSVEMDQDRQVTERGDFLFDRNGAPINACVEYYYSLSNEQNVILF